MNRISDSILEHPQRWGGAVLLLTLAFVLLVDGRPALQEWGRAPRNITAALEVIPSQVVAQVLPVVDRRAAALTRTAQQELRHGIDGGIQAAGGLAAMADGRLESIQQQVERTTKDLTSQVAGARADLAPVLKGTAALVQDAQDSLDDLYPDVKATMESATVAVTSVAQAADAARAAAPAITSSVGRAADESALTAQQSRIFMGHLAEATRPLPLALRIGLAVAPSVVQTGFTIGSWMALRGKDK